MAENWLSTEEYPLPPYDPRSGIPEWLYGHEAEYANQYGEQALLNLLNFGTPGGGTMANITDGGGGVYPRYFVQDNGDGTFSLVQEYAPGGFTVMASGTRTDMEKMYNAKVGAAATTGGITEEHRQGLKMAGYADWANPNLTEADFARISAGAQAGAGATTGGTGATAFLNANPDIRNFYYANGWQGQPDTAILTDWVKNAAGTDTRKAAAQTALAGGAYQLEPTTYEKSLISGQTIPATATTGELTGGVNEPAYWEEKLYPFLQYLMGQRGLQTTGTPLSQYYQEMVPSAERAQWAQRALGYMGQATPESAATSEFLPKYLGAGGAGQLSMSQLGQIAANPDVAALAGQISANDLLALLAQTKMPWMSAASNYMGYLRGTVAPELYTKWQAQGPTATTNQTYLQYLLSRYGGGA
jgi:hypothetical protein